MQMQETIPTNSEQYLEIYFLFSMKSIDFMTSLYVLEPKKTSFLLTFLSVACFHKVRNYTIDLAESLYHIF